MLKTDIKLEVRKLCLDEKISLSDLAERQGTSKQYASRLLGKDTLVNKMLIDLVEELGYDMEIKFVKRGE